MNQSSPYQTQQPQFYQGNPQYDYPFKNPNSQPNHEAFDITEQEHPRDLYELGFNERQGFIAKVYSIISLQLFVTFIMTLAAYLSIPFRDFLTYPETGKPSLFVWVCFSLSIITEISILCCKNVARQVPMNYIALLTFTFSFSVVIAAICGAYYDIFKQNGGFLVLSAALMTLVVSISLTAYACTTKSDHTIMTGALWIIFAIILVISIISWYNTSLFFELIMSGVAAMCFGFYLIYDTELIVGGKSYELSIDDYIIAALLIYIDIIILFLRILEILAIIFGDRN